MRSPSLVQQHITIGQALIPRTRVYIAAARIAFPALTIKLRRVRSGPLDILVHGRSSDVCTFSRNLSAFL